MLGSVSRRLICNAARTNISSKTYSKQLRAFSWTSSTLDNQTSDKKPNTGSVFGDVTDFKQSDSDVLSRLQTAETDGSNEWTPPKTNRELREDPEVKALMFPESKTAVEQLLSPLKRALYEKVTQNGTIPFKNRTIVEHEGKKYRLYLSAEELDVLKPSLYLKSYRIKYSPKKTYIFLRMLRKMDLKEAITQCQFNNKKISRELIPMFTKGLEHAKSLGLNPDDLYIQQIWVGKDGGVIKRPDIKGRGRAGMIEHKFCHVRAILREKSYERENKEATQAKRDKRPAWIQLPSRKLIEFPRIQAYKW